MLQSNNNFYGIKLKKSQRHIFNFSGTKLSIQVPPQSLRHGVANQLPYEYNIFDVDRLDLRTEGKQTFGGFICYNSGWSVYEKYFIFPVYTGGLYFSISIDYFDVENSFFISKIFESYVNRELGRLYGPRSEWYLRFKCRLKWHYENINSVNWLSYTTKKNDNSSEMIEYLTPIGDQHYIVISFNKLCVKDDVDINPYLDNITQQLMSKVELILSPDALRQQREAKEKYPNDKPTEFMPELTWSEPPPAPPEEESVLSDEEVARIKAMYGVE